MLLKKSRRKGPYLLKTHSESRWQPFPSARPCPWSRVLAEHLSGLFPSDAEIVYGVQTSELATKSGGWQGTTDWCLIVGRLLLYVSVSIAPDPSGGSRATTQHKIRRIDSISKIDIETVNVEVGGIGTKEGITVTVTFTDGEAWKVETNAPRPESVAVRRFVAEITRRAPAT
jgi:hypothetical protein